MSRSTFASDRRALLRAFSAMAGLALAPAASADEAPPAAPGACAATDAELPAPLAAWPHKVELVAATTPAGLGAASIAAGQAAHVALHGTREVTYASQPAKPGGSVAHGGLIQIVVDQPGTYRVALSSGAWIDLVRDGQAVASTAHGHGPACSTIRKMVDFPLQPGAYVLQISANAEPAISVLATKVP
jgi:hypothetical protein